MWQQFLQAVSFMLVVFGLAMAFLSSTVLFAPFDQHINQVFFGTPTAPSQTSAFQRWVYGAWGSTVAGWGIFATFIVRNSFKRREKWARNCIVAGIALWFLIDTAFSAAFMVYANVVLNCVIFVLVMIPVLFTWHDFDTDKPNSE